MENETTPISAYVLRDLIRSAARARILEKAVFSKCRDNAVVRRTLTPKFVKGTAVLQVETFRQADVAEVKGKGKPVQAGQENLSAEDDDIQVSKLNGYIEASDQVNVFTTAGNCEFKRSKGGKEVLIGANPILEALKNPETLASSPKKLVLGGNDRVKNHILNGNEPFLIRLGVSDAGGRVHDKKQPKFRQINRFLELIRDAERVLPQTGELHICDLCCGKSYLSFAVYHYFSVIKKRQVRMVGVDMKADVMDECNLIARDLCMTGLSFVCADVSKYTTDMPVDMVISLHACDIATDIVLDKALEWQTKLILSTPCCHHELNRTLNCAALSFVAEHSMLRQKLCDAATDALRLKKLEANGYDVAALELIDPEETPKNIMLRGILKYDPSSERCRHAAEEYRLAQAFLLGQTV